MVILAAVPSRPTPRDAVPRSRFFATTDALIATGDQLAATPDWETFRSWLLDSDRFLEEVWGAMDRYHLAWLNVGRDSQPPGSPLDAAGTERFVREIATAKVAVLRTMRHAVELHGSPRIADEEEA